MKSAFENKTYNEKEIKDKITEIKNRYGKRLLILGHHYQRMEIIEFSDLIGDSFGLSKDAANHSDAEFIVFCGVNFMGESAKILSLPRQKVFIPNVEAGCPLSEMADIYDVERAFQQTTMIIGDSVVVPITYMNSSAALKNFCGRAGGAVCTSRNAESAFKWALSKGKIFFFPDQNLGINTANKLKIPQDKTIVWNPELPLGGNTEKAIKEAQIMLWYGFCHVHTRFGKKDIENVRNREREAKIVVHPECTEDVVKLADANGSTNFIADYVKRAQDGSIIYIGTEINLIARLAKENPKKFVYELSRSICPNMYRINLRNLLNTLSNLEKTPDVYVDKDIAYGAKLALDRMLLLN